MFMKFTLWFALALALFLTACGSGSTNSNNVSGNWVATLTNTAGTAVYTINTSLSQSSTDAVTGSFTFTAGGTPCFEEVGSETGQLTLGTTTNTLQLSIVGGQPGGLSLNTLTLNGTVSGSSISGTWTLAGFGSGCNGSGSFTMKKS
jgi:hypothetical protein